MKPNETKEGDYIEPIEVTDTPVEEPTKETYEPTQEEVVRYAIKEIMKIQAKRAQLSVENKEKGSRLYAFPTDHLPTDDDSLYNEFVLLDQKQSNLSSSLRTFLMESLLQAKMTLSMFGGEPPQAVDAAPSDAE